MVALQHKLIFPDCTEIGELKEILNKFDVPSYAEICWDSDEYELSIKWDVS